MIEERTLKIDGRDGAVTIPVKISTSLAQGISSGSDSTTLSTILQECKHGFVINDTGYSRRS
jgi:hypothetical protein